MKNSTRNLKKTTKDFSEILNTSGLFDLLTIQQQGKMALDGLHKQLGVMLIESILQIEREEMTGASHYPTEPCFYKWGHQGGSVFIGDQKEKIRKPRMTRNGTEVTSPAYEKLKNPGAFSEEILTKIMAGISCRQYGKTVTDAADAFGVSRSSISKRFVEASTKQLKEFLERDLSNFEPFAILIDTVHRGGVAFIVALGIDIKGDKMILGFWEGATENSTITKELFDDLERRKLRLTNEIIFITDGGSGVIKALRARFGKKLVHQRCTIHKDRNIQKHLAKKYRDLSHKKFKLALSHSKYNDAKKELEKMESWLKEINMSAANSLREGFDEILTLHRLGVPDELRRVLTTTNGIENVFSTTRHREKNLKNYNPEYKGKVVKKNLSRRWLATVLLNAETGFRKVKGHKQITKVIASIRRNHEEKVDNNYAMAA